MCKRELTEFLAELTEFAAELSEFSSPKQYSRNSIPPVPHQLREKRKGVGRVGLGVDRQINRQVNARAFVKTTLSANFGQRLVGSFYLHG